MSKGLCYYAFDVLVSHLNHSPAAPLSHWLELASESMDQFPKKAPLFITWDKNDDLRGCIGTFSSLPLESGVKRFALTAALEDTRFSPIATNELSSLSCSVTLLDKFTPIQDPQAWIVGKHGLRLTFQVSGGYYSGTFLPSVAEEQGWDVVTTLWYLLRKADYEGVSKGKTVAFYEKGIREGWLDLETYEGAKDTVYYDEFKDVSTR